MLAQINSEIEAEAESEDYFDYDDTELAQIDADLEAEAEFEADKEQVMGYFNNFLAQIGIEDSEELLAQL